jgi:G:T-mismatch repair DNA endonuclease (very short patch repair protein)
MKSIRPKGNFSTEQMFKNCMRDFGIREWRSHLNLPGRVLLQSEMENWLRKVTYNRKHDRDVTRRLRKCGWIVIRITEHLVRKRPETALRRLLRHVT